MGSLERQPKKNIIKNATRIAAPLMITLLSACSPHYTADIPACDTDPQPKTQSFILYENVWRGNKHSVTIDNIIIKKGESPSTIDLDQSNQPKDHRLMFLSEDKMQFTDSRNNGRNYTISKEPVGVRDVKIAIQADCETPSKTNP